jgi:hypothetical protein
MMKRLIPFAIAFATQLFAARASAETGVDPFTGAPVQTLGANLWPPHRPRPTFPIQRRGRYHENAKRMAVVGGRVTYDVPPPKFSGSKGLRP